MNGYARLPHLAIVIHPAGIHCGTRGTHLTVQFLGQLEEHVEAFLLPTS